MNTYLKFKYNDWTNGVFFLPSDWYLNEVLLLAMPKKDGWGGLADGPRVLEAVVSRWISEQMQGAL